MTDVKYKRCDICKRDTASQLKRDNIRLFSFCAMSDGSLVFSEDTHKYNSHVCRQCVEAMSEWLHFQNVRAISVLGGSYLGGSDASGH